ncbi:hypothetical protein B7D92_13795 [Staphylococcus aureus]|uniref:hypothetical protein n=1 Tax=Staphylococcus aureus TaxID=1280 RepID=UPI000B967322|nr:hypothetical protein [Staphylococcus aureus]OYN36400.1 hypothetical protein B7D92_13795 [Staphylococcus aureus]
MNDWFLSGIHPFLYSLENNKDHINVTNKPRDINNKDFVVVMKSIDIKSSKNRNCIVTIDYCFSHSKDIFFGFALEDDNEIIIKKEKIKLHEHKDVFHLKIPIITDTKILYYGFQFYGVNQLKIK